MIRLLSAFVRTRWLAHRLKTRADINAWQAKRLKRLQEKTLPSFPFYRQSGKVDFDALPVIDKSILMSRFADFNRPGVTAEQGWAIFEGKAPQRPGLSVGASTGTSGNRGLYIVSDDERFEWLGTLLAKVLPRFPFETAKIALILPLNSALYGAARHTPRLSLKFFDLHDGLDAILPGVEAYAPDTVIAPPKVLRALAEAGSALKLRRIFSGAEVLDPLDRAVIEAHFGGVVREIYMATEGLLGVACAYGTLHLCEDVVAFEWETPAQDAALVAPVITDLRRTTQAMCRYRMNDLLRLSPARCPCGSAFQVVEAVIGRCDDMLHIDGRALTPDILRNAIVDSDRRILDFRLRQTGAARLELTLSDALAPETAHAAVQAAVQALHGVLNGLGVAAQIDVRHERLETSARKLRRVERVWKG